MKKDYRANLSRPRITVLMPVYNGERFLASAIESVLTQSFADFEFLIINDGSTDRSVEIIQNYPDPRIRIVHQENRGVAEALRMGIQLARGEYVARMDADDECVPERLALQKKVLDEHPEVCLVHGMHDLIDGSGKVVRKNCGLPRTDKQTKWLLLWGNIISHPTVMLRMTSLKANGLNFRPETNGAEDFDLWNRLSEKGVFYYLPTVLLRYRMHAGSVNRLDRGRRQMQAYQLVLRENFNRYGLPLSSKQTEELAVLSGQTGTNPLTYPYRHLPESLPVLFENLSRKFEQKTGVRPAELLRVQAEQLGRWARYLLQHSPSRAKVIWIKAWRRHPRILFQKAYLLTGLALFLPSETVARINRSRTRPLY